MAFASEEVEIKEFHSFRIKLHVGGQFLYGKAGFFFCRQAHFSLYTVFYKGKIFEISLYIRKMHMITVKYHGCIFIQNFVVAERTFFNNCMSDQDIPVSRVPAQMPGIVHNQRTIRNTYHTIP